MQETAYIVLLGFLRKIKPFNYPDIFINDDTIATATTNITTNTTTTTTTTTTNSSGSSSSRTDTLSN
jgi:hypothetical protein